MLNIPGRGLTHPHKQQRNSHLQDRIKKIRGSSNAGSGCQQSIGTDMEKMAIELKEAEVQLVTAAAGAGVGALEQDPEHAVRHGGCVA